MQAHQANQADANGLDELSWRFLGEGGANVLFAYTGQLHHLVRA